MTEPIDVAVIGAGAAGLSAAVTLSRFRRSVVVVDDGAPRNATAGHVHNFLTRDGTPPSELLRIGRAEVERYGGRLVDGRVRGVSGGLGAFSVDLGDGRPITAGRVVVATGGRDELPDLPGVAARWGRDVLHCPFCHGWEVRDRRIGVLATGPLAGHQATLFRLLSPHVTVLAHTAPPDADGAAGLTRRGIDVVDGVVRGLVVRDDRLVGVELGDGTVVALDALVVATTVRSRSDFLAPLGLHPTELRVGDQVVATRIETGPNGATPVPGVWVAGNAADPMAQVVSSAAAGLATGAAVVADLLAAS